MDCELQPQQACRRDLARQVAHDHLAAYAAMVDRDAVFPADNIAALRAAGLLDLLTPTHDGGGAVDWQTFVHVMAEIGGACGSTGLIAIMHCAAMMLLAVGGTRRNKSGTSAPPALERSGACPSVQPAPARNACGLRRWPGRRRAALSSQAARPCAPVRRPPSLSSSAPSSRRIRRPCASWSRVRTGLTVAPTWDAMGMRASASHDLVCEDYQAATHERLGGEGAGDELGRRRPPFVLGFAATYLGIAEAAAASRWSMPGPGGANPRTSRCRAMRASGSWSRPWTRPS